MLEFPLALALSLANIYIANEPSRSNDPGAGVSVVLRKRSKKKRKEAYEKTLGSHAYSTKAPREANRTVGAGKKKSSRYKRK